MGEEEVVGAMEAIPPWKMTTIQQLVQKYT